MANTYLNTSTPTVMATSNPEANVAQVDSNATPQVPQQATTNSGINPITIPIQIQPQIAQTPTAPVQQNVPSNVQNTPQVNNAPKPQQYQNDNKNNNIVDFNQIYSNYQSAFGNNSNNQVNNSGIKKTSLGTTIVTPTAANLNSIQGQYQSAYADSINSLISEMLTQMQGGFNYDPLQDQSLKVATEYAANTTLQSLAGSGVLNSTATAERVARIVSELIPTYEEKAHNRWIEYLGQLADTAQVVMGYDSQQFQYWKDAKDREFADKEFEYKKQQDALLNAWKRVDELGYVDNNASTVLGVPVGTLSGDARLAMEEREFQLQKMREQAQIEYENSKALYQLRSQLDLEQSKQLAAYNANINRENAKYEYELQKQYGTSKTNSSNSSKFSTYDEIIKNRYATYNELTKQYTVPDETTYNELGQYLDTLLASDLITEEEFLQLASKYSTYAGKTNGSTNTSTSTNANSNNTSQTGLDKAFKNSISNVKRFLGIKN